MELKSLSGKKIEVADTAFSRPYNDELVHQLVTAYQAGARQGSKQQKTRAMVRGGGKKPWRQKGTGRARAGTNRSPLWRGGGKVFAASPRLYKQKVNRKQYRNGIKVILSELYRSGRLNIIDQFQVAKPKTKEFLLAVNSLGITIEKNECILLIDEKIDQNIVLSSRNLVNFKTVSVDHLSPVSLVAANKVLMTESALKKIEEVLF